MIFLGYVLAQYVPPRLDFKTDPILFFSQGPPPHGFPPGHGPHGGHLPRPGEHIDSCVDPSDWVEIDPSDGHLPPGFEAWQRAELSLPSSADDIFLISPGFNAGGVLHLVEAADRDDIGVEVSVGSSGNSDLFKRTKLCTLRRGEDGHGVGIFVSRPAERILCCVFCFVFTCGPDRLICPNINIIPEIEIIEIRCFSTSRSPFPRARTSPLFPASRPTCPSSVISSKHLKRMPLVPFVFILLTVPSSSRYSPTPFLFLLL